MLVSLFRANPAAFIGSNMNRLKAGVVLSVPSAETAQAVPAGEARQTITAQSADFGAYRQRLASSTLDSAPAAEPNRRQSGGRVQASVDDKKQSASTSPDKLKLSKGGARRPSAPGSAEDRLSRERQTPGVEAARVAELNRNLNDLKGLQGTASQPPATAPTTTGPAAAPPPIVAPRAPASSPTAMPAPIPAPTPAIAAAPSPSRPRTLCRRP